MARYYATTNNANWGVFYDVTEGSYSIENNTSPVTVSVYLYRPNSASYYGGTVNMSVTLDGQTQASTALPAYPTNIGVGENNAHLMTTLSFTVAHNDDGSKNISFSLGWSANFNPTSASGSGSMSLATIPRASTISSVSTANIGSNATITVDRKSASFTHTITYAFGSLTGTVVNKSSSTSVSWTIPTSFYAQIPNAKTGNGTLTITTYSGNTQVGSSSSKSFSVTTSESACAPTLSTSVVDSNTTTVNITHNSSIMIAGYSTAKVSYTGTPRNSAAIKTISVNNSSAYSGTSTSAVSGNKSLTNFNSNTITIVVTDSRGYSTTQTLRAGTNYTLINYIPLTFSGEVSRQTPTGSTLLISFSGRFYNGNLGSTTNSLTISWDYRVKGTSNWTTGGTFTQGTHYTINTSNNTFSSGSGSSQTAISLGSSYNYQTNYEFRISYRDALVNTSTTLEGKKGIPIVNWSDDFFNVNGDFKINNVKMQPNASSTVSGGIKVRVSGNTLYITTDGSNP